MAENSSNNSHKYLQIAQINVNSIIANLRRYNLQKFIDNHSPDILLLSETKLNPKYKPYFPNYTILRSDRPSSKRGGGTAILIKENISHERIYTPSSAHNKILEYTIIKIKLNHNKKLYVISAYANNEDNEIFINEINYLFNKLNLSSHNNYYLLAGDLNARHQSWGDRESNCKGRLLKKWYDDNCINFKASLYGPHTASFPSADTYLDLCISDSRLHFTDLVDMKIRTHIYESDHMALKYTIETANLELLSYQEENNKSFLFKKTNWKKFKKELNSLCDFEIPHDRNLTINEINHYLAEISKNINISIQKIVPKYQPKKDVFTYLNHKTVKLHKYKSYLLTILNKYRKGLLNINLNTTFIKFLINSININLKAEFKSLYTKHWEAEHKKINYRDPSKFFPKINQHFRPRQPPELGTLKVDENELELMQRSECDVNNLFKIDNKFFIENPNDVLNIMGAFYEKINSPRYTNVNTRIKGIVDNAIEKYKQEFNQRRELNVGITNFNAKNTAINPNTTNIGELNFFASYESVYQIFARLPNKTSSGLDKIPHIVLKNLSSKVILYYTILFNNCLNLKYFPTEWKCAKILPILKKGKDATLPTSFRPISLTQNISKIYESLINNLITKFSEENKIIPDNQFGFRFKHSTYHAINKLLQDVNEKLYEKKFVAACLIDIEKAFDSVWINGLLYKLIKLNFPIELIDLIYDMIKDKQFVTWDGKNLSSIKFIIKEGLQQGTVNSPKLYNIYTHAVLNLFNQNLDNNEASIAFADDYIAYVTGDTAAQAKTKLETLVNKINKYYLTWNLRPSATKCETILFHQPQRFLSQRKNIKDFCIKIFGDNNSQDSVIAHKKTVKYLGVTIDYLLRLNTHLSQQLDKANKTFRSLARLFYSNNLEPRAKVICYLLLIRPILTYGAPLWWNTSASMMEKFRKFERKCLKAALHMYRTPYSNFERHYSNSDIYNAAGIPRIDNFIIKLTRDYYNSNSGHKNSIINSFTNIKNQEWALRAPSGYFSPQAFMYFDKIGNIQDSNNTPIIYHVSRNKANKSINFSKQMLNDLKYSTSIPNRDLHDFSRITNKYFWLSQDDKLIDEIRRRMLRKKHHQNNLL